MPGFGLLALLLAFRDYQVDPAFVVNPESAKVWTPPRGFHVAAIIVIAARDFLTLGAIFVGVSLAERPSNTLVLQACSFGLAVLLGFPGIILHAAMRAGRVRLVEYMVRLLLIPFGGRREPEATALFYGALCALRRHGKDAEFAAHYGNELAKCPHPGPVHLATSALVEALSGRVDEARTRLEVVLLLDGRADVGSLDSSLGQVPSFVHRFAERELVFDRLARGDFAGLVELASSSRSGLVQFAAASASCLLGRPDAASRGGILVRYLICGAPMAMLPLLRRVLSHRDRGVLAREAFDGRDCAALLAEVLRLRWLPSERSRVAAADAVSLELEAMESEGTLTTSVLRRLERLHASGRPDLAVAALVNVAREEIDDALADVPIARSDVRSSTLNLIVDRRLERALDRLGHQVDEFAASVAADPFARFARSARAFWCIRDAHRAILEVDPDLRAALYRNELSTLWSASLRHGEEGNWMLACGVARYLLREARATGNSADVPVLLENVRFFR